MSELKQPIALDKKLELWAKDTLEAIKANFSTQRVYPFEPYPQYAEKNKRNTDHNRHAFDTLFAQVREYAGGDSFKIDFFFNYYLYFVDMGVGRAQPISKVSRSRNAQHDQRYAEWRNKGDRQSRPILNMEFNHQRRRLIRSLESRYAQLGQLYIIHGLEGTTP